MAKKIMVTCGDPAGCGPAVVLEALSVFNKKKAEFFIVGDTPVFEARSSYRKIKKRAFFIDAKTPGIGRLRPGRGSRLSGEASLNYLRIAVKALKEDRSFCRLVTAPVSKEAVGMVLPLFSGHTEYLAENFNIGRPVMMMVSSRLKVALLTRHIPLMELGSALVAGDIASDLRLIYESLQQQFKIKKPKIACASVNPHAGIFTFLGREEKTLLSAVKMASYPIEGPFPADSLFNAGAFKKYDCFVCAYHDQGMIPFKLLAMFSGVNMTLGLPFVRTSCAHGTAFDLVSRGRTPDASSMRAALEYAFKLDRLPGER